MRCVDADVNLGRRAERVLHGQPRMLGILSLVPSRSNFDDGRPLKENDETVE